MQVKKKPITPFRHPNPALDKKLEGLMGWRDPANQVVHKPTRDRAAEKQHVVCGEQRALAK